MAWRTSTSRCLLTSLCLALCLESQVRADTDSDAVVATVYPLEAADLFSPRAPLSSFIASMKESYDCGRGQKGRTSASRADRAAPVGRLLDFSTWAVLRPRCDATRVARPVPA